MVGRTVVVCEAQEYSGALLNLLHAQPCNATISSMGTEMQLLMVVSKDNNHHVSYHNGINFPDKHRQLNVVSAQNLFYNTCQNQTIFA